MSKKNEIEVVCPHCEEKQNVIVWSSLNITLDPEARERLLKNRINRISCENCEKELPLRIGLLYHDMERGFCVQYFPIEMIVKENTAARFNRYGNLKSGFNPKDGGENTKPFNYMDHIHIVFSMEELVRYVIFREKLFDDYRASHQKTSSST